MMANQFQRTALDIRFVFMSTMHGTLRPKQNNGGSYRSDVCKIGGRNIFHMVCCQFVNLSTLRYTHKIDAHIILVVFYSDSIMRDRDHE